MPTIDADTLAQEFEKAQNIINDYGAVLQTASAMAYGVPESLLPHVKEEIKKAIKLTVLVLLKIEPDVQTTIEQLKSAYTLLANFVPDEDAKLLAKGHLYLTKNPRKVLVVVDTFFSTQSVWHRVPEVLTGIGSRRYTQFSLITEKNHVHGWAPKLELSRVSRYAPRNLSRLMNKGNYPELDEATETYLLTNAEAS